MDMSKAFDKVKHGLLFYKLLDRGVPEIFIRLLVCMYRKQLAYVRWNNSDSQQFPLRNGVKQGAVLSAILYCLYMNDLYQILRKKKYGCWINGEYSGILGYSDDILLQSPSINALKEMLKTCENYANEHNLQFSTDANPVKSKTKCMAFVRGNKDLKSIELCGNELPWVNEIKHLGTVITNDQDVMASDIMQKRAIYINRNNELIQEFHFAHASTLIKINNSFNTSFYGSVLWDLFGTEAKRLEKSWNVSLRKILRLPYNAHRYLLEPVTNTRHIITSLYSRYINFVDKLYSSKKSAVRNLFNVVRNDCRSITGSNLRRIMLKTNRNCVEEINMNDINNLVYQNTPNGCEWAINMVNDISNLVYQNTPNGCEWAINMVNDINNLVYQNTPNGLVVPGFDQHGERNSGTQLWPSGGSRFQWTRISRYIQRCLRLINFLIL